MGEASAGSGSFLTPVHPRISPTSHNLEARLAGFLPRKERIRIYQPSLSLQIGLELEPRHSYDQP